MSQSFNIDLKGYDVISIINDHNSTNSDPYFAKNAIIN